MTENTGKFITLYRASLIPLHACLVGLTWIVHDYLITLEDEVRVTVVDTEHAQSGTLFLNRYVIFGYSDYYLLAYQRTHLSQSQKPGFSKYMFLWVTRVYTVFSRSAD
ncbi:hypothetical protein H2248_003161 [Termitomyces sp. 'cryptogamus']|nr:hypothetical protein H2248_003161 [Termitomyces sp. 'cryptogamus']